MALDPDLAALLQQAIYVAPRVNDTSSGDGIFGQAVMAMARVEPKRQVTDVAPSGEETVSQYRIFTALPVGDRDHIWLPGTDPSDPTAARLPMGVQQHVDEDGSPVCFEVLL